MRNNSHEYILGKISRRNPPHSPQPGPQKAIPGGSLGRKSEPFHRVISASPLSCALLTPRMSATLHLTTAWYKRSKTNSKDLPLPQRLCRTPSAPEGARISRFVLWKTSVLMLSVFLDIWLSIIARGHCILNPHRRPITSRWMTDLSFSPRHNRVVQDSPTPNRRLRAHSFQRVK